MKFSKPVSKDFTNASQIALQAQSNAMFYVGDNAPSNPKTGMVWVKVNQANDNWLAHGTTTNQLKTATMPRGNRFLPDSEKVYGTPGVKPSGTIMTLSCWLDLTGETTTDIYIDGLAYSDSHGGDWWFSKNQTVSGAMQPVKAGTKGWITLTVKFPRDTELSHIPFYVYANDNVSQDVKIGYSSWKLDWDSKRTEWCDGANYDKGNIQDAQKWDGSKWVPTQFTSDVIADYIYGKNIIGSTFANADGSFKVDSSGNITGANVTGSSFNTSTGIVDQYGNDTPWMPWKWDSSTITIGNGFISTRATNAFVPGAGFRANGIGTYAPTYLKFTLWDPNGSKEYGRSYMDGSGMYVGIGSDMTSIGSDSVQSDTVVARSELRAANFALDANTIYNTKHDDIYFTHGSVGTSYHHSPATIHASVVNASTLSVKTNLQKLTEQDAINAIKNIDEYSYQYIGDADSGSKQRYVSGIIDDVNATPHYKMDKLFVYEGGKDRVDSNLLNVQTVVIQNLLKRVESLEKTQAVSS